MLKVLAVLGVSLPLAMAQSGTVESGGQPIPGVTIRASMGERALTTVSDEKGAFQFQDMIPGTWSVEASIFGFQPAKKDVTVGSTPVKIDLELQLASPQEITQQAPPRGAGGGGGGRGGRGGFQGGRGGANGAVAQQQQQPQAGPEFAANDLTQTVNAGTANDSFQIEGTVSTGLETNGNDFRDFGGRGGFPGGFDGGPEGNGPPGGRGGDFGGGRGGRGGGGGGGNFAGGGFGGPGGFGGGRGGGGFGGRGGGGGGNFRGRGGRGGARGLIGNRSRQGANQIRVNIFDNISSSSFNAKSYSISGQPVVKPSSMQNRYGVNIGGPLVIPHVLDLGSKLNFTVNYNGTVRKQPSAGFSTVPTDDLRQGIFSSPIYDPNSGGLSQFPNNTIPLTRYDPIAAMLLQNYIPAGNQNGAIQNNYQLVTNPFTNQQQVSLRLQYQVSARDRLSFTVQTQSNHNENFTNFGYKDTNHSLGQNESVQYTHNFTSSLFNSFQAGLNRNNSVGTPYFQTLGQDIEGQLGINGYWNDPTAYGPPTISIAGYTGLNDGAPSKQTTQTEQTQDNLSWRHGKHNLQFGGSYNRQAISILRASSARGSFSFTGASTQQYVTVTDPSRCAGAASCLLGVQGTGDPFADFVLGLPQSDSVTWGAHRYFHENQFGLFAGDDYRLSNKLSLNLGVRWDYVPPETEEYGRLANLAFGPNFSSATVVTPATAGAPSSGLVQPQHNAISPRVGFAWQVSRKGDLVIRGGYGINYNTGIYNQLVQSLAVAPQFVLSTGNLQSTHANVLTLANGLTMIPANTTLTNSTAYATDLKLPYAQQWQLNIQRNLPWNMVLQVGYNGVKATHLTRGFDPNQATPGPVESWQQRIPISYLGLLTYLENGANSISHQGQISVFRRMRSNLAFQISYSRTRAIDDAVTNALNPLNLAAERALSSSDRPNALQVQLTWESPVDQRNGFLANHGFLTKALKDWTFQAPVTYQSGSLFTPTVQGDIAGIGATTAERAQYTGAPLYLSSGFFNPDAFVVPAAGTFGNAGRNIIRGPSTVTVNLNMARNFQIKERKNLEIQINANNLFNHPNPTAFGTVVGTPTFDVLTGMGGMRTISGNIRFRM